MSTLTIIHKKRKRLQDFRPNAMWGIKVYFKNGDMAVLRCKTKEAMDAEIKKQIQNPEVKSIVPFFRKGD